MKASPNFTSKAKQAQANARLFLAQKLTSMSESEMPRKRHAELTTKRDMRSPQKTKYEHQIPQLNFSHPRKKVFREENILCFRLSRCPLLIPARRSSSTRSFSVSIKHSLFDPRKILYISVAICFVSGSAKCFHVGSHRTRKMPCSTILLTINRSKAACFSLAIDPILWMWSFKAFASVSKIPAACKVSLQSGCTSVFPKNKAPNRTRLKRSLSAAAVRAQDSAAKLERTMR